MNVQLTAAGAQARSIARWAWQDPPGRAVAALERVNELAAAASGDALAEIQDTSQMLSRLAGAVNAPERPPRLVSAQLSSPVTISEQIELAAIGHHHIPGTQYTFRHGWIPVVGGFFNDDYAEWKVKHDAEVARKAQDAATKAGNADIKQAVSEAKSQGTKQRGSKYTPAPPIAGQRPMTPEMKQMLAAHQAQMTRADRAAAKASSPTAPTRLSGRAQALKDSGAKHYQTPQEATQAMARERSQTARDAGAKTVGEGLQQTDPALAALAQPGASMAALKTYIDARVAAEVAKQVGQITAQQHEDLQKSMSKVHKGQQKLIAAIRGEHSRVTNQSDHQDRTHLVMYNLFAAANLGVALGGLSLGLSPVAAMLAAAVIPLATTIHDYVRGM
jgi:hypothetical protein